jgi:hypothetical protein
MPQNGLMLANTAVVVSAVLIGVSVGLLFSQIDSRLVVTFTETFGEFAELRGFLNNTRTYIAGYNPVDVSHVTFPPGLQTLEEVEDLKRRGIIKESDVKNLIISNVTGPSILNHLMMRSWCSSGLPIPHTIPAKRTPGCECIAKAYITLVNGSRPANATNLTVVNVPEELRKAASEQLFKCWDQRLVTRSRSCGRTCTTHISGLALFANAVLFLACASFMLSYNLKWNVYAVKALILLMGAVFITFFLVKDTEANVMNAVWILISLVLLTVVLHDELNPDFLERVVDEDGIVKMPHPLMVSVLVNLPLILSAHAFQISVSNYGRDIWTLVSFGVCGGLFGVLLQVRDIFL